MSKIPVEMVSGITRERAAAGKPGAAPSGRKVLKRSADALARVPLFAGLSRRQLNQLADVADEVRFRPGANVIREGEMGEALFVVLEGRARVTRGGKRLAEIAPGDFFGEISLVDRGPRSATVRAEGDLTTLRLFRRSLMRLIEGEPVVAQRLLAALAGRLRRADRRTRS